MTPFEVNGAMGKLSDSELAQLAQQPALVPGAQLAAIQELDKRNQMRKSLNTQKPSTTVLEDRIAQSMPRQPSTGASDPIRAGLASIIQSQQAPQRFAEGGPVRSSYAGQFIGDLAALMPELQQYIPGPSSPEEALALAQQFRGKDRLSPWESRLSDRENQLNDDRRRDRWLGVAQAAFEGMNAPSFARGLSRIGSGVASNISDVDARYRTEQDALMARQMGLASSLQNRDDATGQAALGMYNDRNDSVLRYGFEGAQSIGRSRDNAATRGAQQQQTAMVIDALTEQLWQQKQHTMVRQPMPGDVPGTTPASFRPYTREDARREATLALAGQGGRGGVPDDLNEMVSSARAIVGDMTAPQELRNQAYAFLGQVFGGEVGNPNSSTQRGLGSAVAATPAPRRASAGERASAPSESASAGSTTSAQIENYQRQRFIPEPNRPYQLDERGELVTR